MRRVGFDNSGNCWLVVYLLSSKGMDIDLVYQLCDILPEPWSRSVMVLAKTDEKA